ncbi:ABC transporter glutamine-binding protein GlnH precursor [Vibrio aerogenes CECT 7868]|uniref:ABC transporter glutamine-binding protein GlnH n=1 Tax=Vibrio aerogenes CECT 7868 TaxID=1216006 RepID=A0A1M6DKT9_9VIBR|nr:transporter substrate-binding domain-containing protein [Vibrio aerogenes]SHI73876.1 ABC transporter glutamine-binding protein GlnH precursor [Vibrio aerogenes CECT 7868]
MKSDQLKKGIRHSLVLLAISSATLSALPATASESTISGILKSGELKFCFEAGYLPFEMTSKNGRFIGFDIDIAKHMARSMGVKFVPVNTGWDGIIPALQTNRCDFIGGMTITPKRNMSVAFADAYFQAGQTVLISPSLKGKIKSYRDLNAPEYTISAQLGTTGAEAAKKYLSKAKLNLFETSADAALQVANNKADAFVYDGSYNAVYSARNPGKVIHLDQPFTFEPLGWAVRQGDSDFVNLLNNYLKQIKGDGTYDRIYNKWFKSNQWLSQLQ